jgi:uncharacterized membrane protein YkvA (DUF1232 family)
MSEIAEFVGRGASRITPQIMRGVQKKLPLLKVEFAQINAPKFPHLIDQLEFLANVLEDYVEGEADELPLCTVAAAAFAVIYAHRQLDLIPDTVPEIGHSDDSSVVRYVLINNERVLAKYAEKIGISWSSVTVKP